jgi:hypothetical protein
MRRIRAAQRRRHNPSYKVHRPVIVESGGLFYRPKFHSKAHKGQISSRLHRWNRKGGIRINPLHRRRSRFLRHNPALNLKRAMSMQNILMLTSIGGGVALGFLGIPLIDRFMPQVVKDQRKWAYGVLYVLLGGFLASAVRNKNLKTLSITIAGMGIYDLISQNILTDLPQILLTNAMIDKMLPQEAVSPAPAPASADYLALPRSGYGVSYNPLSPANAMGGDNPYDGVTW